MSGLDNTSYTVRTTALAADTLTAQDSVVIYTNAAAKTVALPLISALTPGRQYTLVNANTGTITVTPAAGTINGGATLVIVAGVAGGSTGVGRATFINDGVNWITLNSQ